MLEICEKIEKMSPENIIFTLGLVTIATTLTKKYTIIIMFFVASRKKVARYPRVPAAMAFCVLCISEFLFWLYKLRNYSLRIEH